MTVVEALKQLAAAVAEGGDNRIEVGVGPHTMAIFEIDVASTAVYQAQRPLKPGHALMHVGPVTVHLRRLPEATPGVVEWCDRCQRRAPNRICVYTDCHGGDSDEPPSHWEAKDCL